MTRFIELIAVKYQMRNNHVIVNYCADLILFLLNPLSDPNIYI